MIEVKYPEYVEAQLKIIDEKIEEIYIVNGAIIGKRLEEPGQVESEE